MASGDILAAWLPGQNDFPTLNAATFNRDADYGFFLEFGDNVDATAVFTGILSMSYAGSGVSVEVVFLMQSAVGGSVVLGAALQNLDNGEDLSGSMSWDENTTTQSVPGSAETVGLATITFFDGVDMDSVGPGEVFRLNIRRVGSNSSDTATGDLRLLAVRVKES